MWMCGLCSKSVEDEEAFCYHCGGEKGAKKAAHPASTSVISANSTPADQTVADYNGIYHRDWLAPVKRLGIRHGAGMIIAPLFGFMAIYGAWTTKHMSVFGRIGFTLLGIALFVISIFYLNAVTKVPGPKG